MNKINIVIDGILYHRVSKKSAEQLSQSTDLPVYIYPVKINPSSMWAGGMLLNNSPLSPIEFSRRIAEYMYYNRSPETGYYPSFYVPLLTD